MSRLRFSLDRGFRASPRPIDLTSKAARKAWEGSGTASGMPMALWGLIALLSVVLGAFIAEAPTWLIP